MERAARTVCTAFLQREAIVRWQPLGNHGGFSGALLWRIETLAGTFCLRAWPPGFPSKEQLQVIHRLMLEAHELGYVPSVHKVAGDPTCVEEGGRLWELTTWLPGLADFQSHPSVERLQAALEAVARLHRLWQANGATTGACGAVARRLVRLEELGPERLERMEAGIRQGQRHLIDAWAGRALSQVRRWRPPACQALNAWVSTYVPLQPCLCDVWHDHILFEGHRVTGIVDYGSIRRDNPAADLARLIGSLVGDDAALRQTAIAEYQKLRPLTEEERALVEVLDWTGVVVGAGNWLRWLYLERKSFEDRTNVLKRIAELVTRMEAWKSKAHGVQPVGLD